MKNEKDRTTKEVKKINEEEISKEINKKKKKTAFTLIELLAVIIILGVLMIIAIPSVTKYIDDSRKSGYVSTAKSIVGGVRNMLYSGELNFDDKDTTYYVDAECVKTDNAYKSPYGDFVNAYVVVTVSDDNYEYYWTSVDDAGRGVKGLINVNKLDSNNIETDINSTDIATNRGLDNREYVVVVNEACQKGNRVARTGTNINGLTGEEIIQICKRATTLHTKTCERASNGCGATIGNGNTITYGTIVNGTPKAGDAYDCDVNNDKIYDSATERFYYIGSDGANSILIYYTNMNNQTTYAYDSSNQNWHGPRKGYQYLPDTSTWSNPGLIAPGTRQIVNENGGTTTIGGTIESFTYTNKAARFLTSQELVSACSSISSVGNYTPGELDGCTWLMENIGFYEKDSASESWGYWLETPRSDNNANNVWYVDGHYRSVHNSVITAGHSTYLGVRPVITIKTSNIE